MPMKRGFPLKIAINYMILEYSYSQLFVMNAAAPEGTLPRRINNPEQFLKNTRNCHPCRTEALEGGALISAIFIVRM